MPLPSDLVLAAASVDETVRAGIGPYLAMTGSPDSLAPARAVAHGVYEAGWRPAYSGGPEPRRAGPDRFVGRV